MVRLIEQLSSLRPSTKAALARSGILYCEEMCSVTPTELAARCPQLPLEEIASILEDVRSDASAPAPCCASAYELWCRERDQPAQRIQTSSKDLDCLLGGGVPVGELVEVAGAPGAGKTQFCHQLAVNVQLPVALGGLAAKCLLVDTEGSFTLTRFREVAQASIDRGQKPGTSRVDSLPPTLETVLDGVLYHRVYSAAELIALLNILPSVVETTGIKLLLIDSIALHFRYGFGESFGQRSRLLFRVAEELQMLAQRHRIAVVVTNQMTTRQIDRDGESISDMIPALGDTWAHGVRTRLVFIHRSVDLRVAALEKSSSRPKGKAHFRICEGGIRDAL